MAPLTDFSTSELLCYNDVTIALKFSFRSD